MDYPLTLPGYESFKFSVYPGGLLSGIKIFYDGKPLKRSKGKFRATLPNGEEIALGLKFSLDIFNPKIVFKDRVITVFPELPKSQLIMIYFPLVLVAQGGAIGGLFGALGAYVNLEIFRGKAAMPVKVILAVLTMVAASFAYLIAAAMVTAAFRK